MNKIVNDPLKFESIIFIYPRQNMGKPQFIEQKAHRKNVK